MQNIPPKRPARWGRRILLGASFVLVLLIGAGFIMRPAPIPSAVIARSVTQTEALLARAWQLPVAASYKRRLVFQSNGSVCGPATLANVFRSLGDQTDSEAEVLAGSGRCWTGLCIPGLTLDQVAEVARLHTRRRVSVLRDLSPAAFLDELRRSNDVRLRYTVNFTRKAIFGSGPGHHSPIGGYLEAEDLVFVLDVNDHFRPWLVERSRLFAAIDTLDGEKKRGLLRIE